MTGFQIFTAISIFTMFFGIGLMVVWIITIGERDSLKKHKNKRA